MNKKTTRNNDCCLAPVLTGKKNRTILQKPLRYSCMTTTLVAYPQKNPAFRLYLSRPKTKASFHSWR